MEIKELEKGFKEQVNILVKEIKSTSKTYGEAIEKARLARFDKRGNLVSTIYFEVEMILEKEMKNMSIK